MEQNEEINDLEVVTDDDADDSVSVDDFIRQLEAREKDLHITADTSIIEIEEGFDDGNPAVFLPEPPSVKSIEPAAPAQTDAAPSAVDEVISLQLEVAELRDKIASLEDEKAEILMGVQRRSRDFDKFRERTERERAENLQGQAAELVSRLLPALDNLHRAIDFASGHEEMTEGFRNFHSGMVLVEKQVFEILQDMGLRHVPAVGAPFDPHLHEAVATEATNDFPPNTVTAELLRGYMVGDRVIRHSMVKVSVSRDDGAPEPVPDASDTTE